MWYERGSPWESLALAFPSYITPRLPVIINITNYFYIKWGTKKVQMLIMLGEDNDVIGNGRPWSHAFQKLQPWDSRLRNEITLRLAMIIMLDGRSQSLIILLFIHTSSIKRPSR